MVVTVHDVDCYEFDVALRMPFHFGDAAVTDVPQAFVEVTAGFDGRCGAGRSSEALSALWFLKDPTLSYSARMAAVREVVASACDRATGVDGASSVFDCWHRLYESQRRWARDTDHPPLLWAFGVSLVERAIIDAFCRVHGTTFAEAVRENTLGIDLGTIHPELASYRPADLLPVEPRRTTVVRHTVGFTDPLTDAALDAADRLDDGLPQTLESYVTEHGLTHFKIKLVGDEERDAGRLTDVARVLDEHAGIYAFTLDANEQYETPDSFRCQWEALASDPTLASFFDRLLYVEQPIARDEALDAAAVATFGEWADRPPVIIDESDGDIDSLPTALACGYDGTSHKNCKGVFKGIANACLIEARRRADPDGSYVLSGEDLSVIGPIGLLQDLAVTATLGLTHVERNGHHYFRGTSMYPDDVGDGLCMAHGDLYRRHDDGFATVDVADGAVRMGSVVDAPFGYDVELDLPRLVAEKDG